MKKGDKVGVGWLETKARVEMPKKQYGVQLSIEDRTYLSEIIEKGTRSAREIRRAHTLLLADEHRQDQDIAAFLHVAAKTIGATR